MLRQPFRYHNRKTGTHGRKAEVADLLGKLVDVPGPVFHDHAPGTLFRCVCVCVCSASIQTAEMFAKSRLLSQNSFIVTQLSIHLYVFAPILP